ncbi:hypothetical protein ODY66_08950, partial [Aerococcus sp. JJEM-2022b]|uniref:hypothetical protein n=1 Tax=Aerococcus mictus TaxID=2976810 RepID=UPI0022799FED
RTVSNKKELAKGQLTIYKVQLIGVTIKNLHGFSILSGNFIGKGLHYRRLKTMREDYDANQTGEKRG